VKAAIFAVVTMLAAAALAGCTKAEDYLRQQVTEHSNLVDPGSAQFRDIRSETNDNGILWCGQINAKNGMGGYVGWKPFILIALNQGRTVLTVAPDIEEYHSWDSYTQWKALADVQQKTRDMITEQCKDTKPRKWVPIWK
jgi:hypothetical protein